LGKRISGLYRKRKEKLQTAIKQKEFQNKMKLLGNSGCKSRNKSKAFWNLLKGPKVQKSVSQIIDPITKSHMLEERDEINNALGKHFSSIGVDSTLESDSKERILNFMKENDELAGTDENTLSILFTKESISNTLMELKSGKAPGIDEILNDFLKFGGDIMIRSLVDMFTAISDIEVIPDDWHIDIIRPLHKSGSLYDIDNYRGITLFSNVYNIFSKTIESTAVNHLESNNILGESQGPFREKTIYSRYTVFVPLQSLRRNPCILLFLIYRRPLTEFGGRDFLVPNVASFSGLSILDCPLFCLSSSCVLCSQCCQFLWIVHS
jgi:hypothetical protein